MESGCTFTWLRLSRPCGLLPSEPEVLYTPLHAYYVIKKSNKSSLKIFRNLNAGGLARLTEGRKHFWVLSRSVVTCLLRFVDPSLPMFQIRECLKVRSQNIFHLNQMFSSRIKELRDMCATNGLAWEADAQLSLFLLPPSGFCLLITNGNLCSINIHWEYRILRSESAGYLL